MAATRRSLQSLAGICSCRVKCGVIIREAYHSSSLQLRDELSDKSAVTKPSENPSTTLQPIQLGGYNALIDLAKQRTGTEKREQFVLALDEFIRREKYRKGHVAFIRIAMQRMEEFGLEKDLITYNRIIDVFPRGRFAPTRMLDAFWPRPTPQLELCLELLTKMEEYGVRPSTETHDIAKAVFGSRSLPVEKCRRIMHLFDKYRDVNPYEIRADLPSSLVELSRLSLFRISGKDAQLMEIKEAELGGEGFIIGGNSGKQLKVLEHLENEGLSQNTFLHVEGPHRLWLKKIKQYYFTIRLSEAKEELSTSIGQTVDEDVVLGVCMCEPSSREALQCWIKELQDKYPRLSQANVIYDLSGQEFEATQELGAEQFQTRLASPSM